MSKRSLRCPFVAFLFLTFGRVYKTPDIVKKNINVYVSFRKHRYNKHRYFFQLYNRATVTLFHNAPFFVLFGRRLSLFGLQRAELKNKPNKPKESRSEVVVASERCLKNTKNA